MTTNGRQTALLGGASRGWSLPIHRRAGKAEAGRKGRSGSTSLRSLPHPKTLTRWEGASVPGTRPLGRRHTLQTPRSIPGWVPALQTGLHGAEAVSGPCPARREHWPRNPPGPLHAQHLRVQPPEGTGGRGGGQRLASTLATPRQGTCHLPEPDTLSQCCPDQPAVGAGTAQTREDPWARDNQKGQGSSCQAWETLRQTNK